MSGSCCWGSFSGSSGGAGGGSSDGVVPFECAGGEGEESSMKRMRPRTQLVLVVGFESVVDAVSNGGGGEGGISRIQTAALSELPEPRRMAGRPVDWMVRTMVDGGVVPVVVSMEVGREKAVECIPIRIKLYQIAVVRSEGASSAELLYQGVSQGLTRCPLRIHRIQEARRRWLRMLLASSWLLLLGKAARKSMCGRKLRRRRRWLRL